jgi:hypothetical protein
MPPQKAAHEGTDRQHPQSQQDRHPRLDLRENPAVWHVELVFANDLGGADEVELTALLDDGISPANLPGSE